MRKLTVIAVTCQFLAAGYLQLVEWVDLFPWNDLSKGNAQEMMDFGLLAGQVLVAVWFTRKKLWLMSLVWTGYAAWFYLQIVS
jgi:hypothetical protein